MSKDRILSLVNFYREVDHENGREFVNMDYSTTDMYGVDIRVGFRRLNINKANGLFKILDSGTQQDLIDKYEHLGFI